MRKLQIMAAGTMALGMLVVGAVALAPRSGPETPSRSLRHSIDGGVRAAPADLDATIAGLEGLAEEGPLDADGLALLGTAYLEKARAAADPSFFDLADRVLGDALAQNPEHLPALVGAGRLALARHDFDRGLSFGRSVARLDAYNSTALGIVGDAQIELGRYGRAFSTYQRMVDLKPNLSSLARVSYARELTGDVSGAIGAMRRALRAGASTPADRAWTTHQLGDLLLSAGRIAEARRAYRSARTIDPDFVPALAGLARVDAARGDLAASERKWAAVVDKSPLPGYVAWLGDVRWALGERAEARSTYRLARIQQRLAEANGVLPDVELTLFLADQGGAPALALRQARSQYRDRASIRTADALAWALYRNGRPVVAQRFIHEAMRLGTKDATLHYHAGMIAAALDRAPSARRHLKVALTIDPSFSLRYAPVARRTLHGLERRS